jgi:hypothetical protein
MAKFGPTLSLAPWLPFSTSKSSSLNNNVVRAVFFVERHEFELGSANMSTQKQYLVVAQIRTNRTSPDFEQKRDGVGS